MDLNKLKIFVDLSKTLNYTDTAENFFTTQGNISKQIKSLEKELESLLFKRAHRKITLTEQGKIVLPFAKKILNNYDEMAIKLTDYQDAKNLKIEMHTIPTMPNYQSFQLVTKFLQNYSKVQMRLKEEESYNLITSLKAGKCDLIFARTFNFNEPTLERIVMEDDNFVAVLPKSTKYSTDSKLSVSELKNENFLILGSSTNLYTPVIELCQQAGFMPHITYEGTRVDLIMQMVQNNMGISIMTAKTARQFSSQAVSVVPLTTNITNKLCFIRVKGKHTKANNLFWNYIQKSIGG